MQNELCKCFVHEIIKEVVFMTFKQAKINELLVALCDGRPCSLGFVFSHKWPYFLTNFNHFSEEVQQKKEEELRLKQEKEQEAVKRKEELKKAKAEEKRLRNEARMKRVQETKQAQEKQRQLAKENEEKSKRLVF